MGEKIYIDSFTGGNDGDDLIDCYFKFKSSDSTYTFHDKDDHSKCTGLTVGSSCSFTLDEFPGITWTITLTNPCTASEVNGDWTSVTAENTQEGGTFQAQDGGGVEEEPEVEDDGEGRKYHIHHIHSEHGTGFGEQLKHCYFELDGDETYALHDPDDGVLKSGITPDEAFFFTYLSQDWEMTVTISLVKKEGHGDWKLLVGISDEIDGGTFQAQAGGGGGIEESAYTANA